MTSRPTAGTSDLASTGSSAATLVPAAAALLGAGVASVWSVRRRRRGHVRHAR
ncbi:LPXTG cell wall anchor domain-containing protein [Sanguibacter inulinus]|uniref:LPXTG cell wall anchor domain-containing protein n=1 Tax=Sanguibacter inulinus TaxID=60922 RepID=UPI00358DCBA0